MKSLLVRSIDDVPTALCEMADEIDAADDAGWWAVTTEDLRQLADVIRRLLAAKKESSR